jgi:hypothetical protein
MSSKLWSNSRDERLKAARALSEDEIKRIHTDLERDCPVDVWPYGSPTTINPMLLTLGLSPGASPFKGDVEYSIRTPFEMPPAGRPHPKVYYKDPRKYWYSVRKLAIQILAQDSLSDEDSLALFGHVNLDTEASGAAKHVQINARYARWVLLNIRNHLRPRILICLGLSGYFKDNPKVANLFEENFSGLKLRCPHRRYELESYQRKKYWFKEWDIVCQHGNKVRIVLWPQHPVRSPMTNEEVWRGACEQFSRRASELFR